MQKTIIKAFILFAMLLTITSISAFAENTKVEVNQKGIVDTITVNPVENYFGDITRITVTFSEKKNGEKLSRNSILTLDKPEDLSLLRINYNDNVYLSDNGVNIARLYTIDDQNKVVVEFLETVEDGVLHKGSFYLDAIAEFPDPESTPDVDQIRSFTTNMGSDAKPADYKIIYRYTEGREDYFYKPDGFVDPDDPHFVTWYLEVNRYLDNFKDIKITDTFKSGQEFVLIDESLGLINDNLAKDYFNFSVGDDDDNYELSVVDFEAKGFGTFEILSTNSFEITINEDILANESVSIYYRTRITQEGKSQELFYNDAIGVWEEDGVVVIRDELNRKAENLFKGGEITPERFTLRVNKTANHGNKSLPLKGVTFKMFEEDGTPVTLGQNNGEFTTDETGQFTTPRIDPGKYYITEIFAPAFVEYNPLEKYSFEVDGYDTVGIDINIKNNVKVKSLNLIKIWEDDLNIHPSIYVSLLADGEVIDHIELADGETTYTWNNLPLYRLDGKEIVYTVSEEEVAGYTSEISGNINDGFTIVNTLDQIKGRIETEKTASVKEIKVGEKFEYSIIVKNTEENSKDLLDVNVYDKLPKGIKFTDGNIYLNGNKVVEAIDDTFTYTLDKVVYGEDYIFTFEVIAGEDAIGTVINKALISSLGDEFIPEEPEVEVIVKENKPVDPKDDDKNPIEKEDVEKPSIKDEEKKDEETSKPSTPSTASYNDSYLYLSILISAFVLIGLLKLSKKSKVI